MYWKRWERIPTRLLENVRAQVQKRELEEEHNRKKFELPPYLKHFGVSLNRLARADKIPPTIGREKEIQQIIEILCHRERANSPMLVGEPGVGKTAVIEGLARLIELEPEKVPARLARVPHRATADGRASLPEPCCAACLKSESRESSTKSKSATT